MSIRTPVAGLRTSALSIRSTSVAASMIALAYSASAGAQSAIEEITVTASKRGVETVQSIPISITAISGETLADSGATQFDEWSRSVPGLTFQDQGPGDKRYIVRGIQSTGAATVAVYLDNAVITGSNGEDDGGGKNVDIRLFDVDRIEVLRGPQGTLYGVGSLSGTIRILTNQPRLDRFESAVGAELSFTEKGGTNWLVNGMVNLPMIDDKLGVRAVGWKVDNSGYIDNVRLGLKDINDEETEGGRLIIAGKPTDRMTLTASFLYQNQDVGGKSFYFPDDGELKNSEYTQGPRQDKVTVSQFEFNYDFDAVNLNISTAYLDRFVDFKFDSTPILIFFGVPDLPAVTLQPEDSSTWTNEARISSKGDGPFQFVAGALYQRLTRSFTSSVVTVDDNGIATQTEPNIFGRISARQIEQHAVFGEGTYAITPKLTAIAGLRWFRSKVHATSQNVFPFFGGPPEEPRESNGSDSKVTPKVSLSYKANEDLMFYALASQGFREGGTNDGGFGSLIVVPEEFESDSLWNYEVGMKSAWLDQRLILNVTAFAIRWSNIQTKNRTPELGFVYIGNAGTASSDGIEAELIARPIDNLDLRASVSFQDARLTEDQPLADPDLGEDADPDAGRDGDRIPNTPRVTANLGAQYKIPVTASMNAVFHGDVSYVGSSQTYFSKRSVFYQELASYTLADLRAGLEGEQWTATLFVKNVFDKRAEVDKLYQTDAPLSVFTNRPRTIGINVGYRF